MVEPKNKIEDLLFSVTENCETLFKQTRTKAKKNIRI